MERCDSPPAASAPKFRCTEASGPISTRSRKQFQRRHQFRRQRHCQRHCHRRNAVSASILRCCASRRRESITITNPEDAPLRVIAVEPIGTNGQRLLGYKIDAEKCLRVLNAGESCTFTIHANIIAVKLRATTQVAVYYVDPPTGGKAIARVAPDCR